MPRHPSRRNQLRWLRFLLILAATLSSLTIIGAASIFDTSSAFFFALGCFVQLVVLALGGWYYFRFHGAHNAKQVVRALRRYAIARYLVALALALAASFWWQITAVQLACLLVGYIVTYTIAAFFLVLYDF